MSWSLRPPQSRFTPSILLIPPAPEKTYLRGQKGLGENRKKKPQISPLRYAPVEMTSLWLRNDAFHKNHLQLRNKLVISTRVVMDPRPTKVMKNETTFHGKSPFPLSSRLPRRAVGAKPRDLQFCGPLLEMFFDRPERNAVVRSAVSFWLADLWVDPAGC
jgi:hypothetical protein